jgi:hypothetical protein
VRPLPRPRRRRGTIGVFLFAILFLAAFVGVSFAAGYLVGRILL